MQLDDEPGTEEQPAAASHALPDGADIHPLVDLTRDPTPGVADHALPEE